MRDRGGGYHLIVFVSVMGSTIKSEVIKALVEFVEGITIFFEWSYGTYVIKVSAYTCVTVCQIPNGRTLYSIVDLHGSKSIGQDKNDLWKSQHSCLSLTKYHFYESLYWKK